MKMWVKKALKNGCKVVHVNLASSTWNSDIISTAVEQRDDKEKGESECRGRKQWPYSHSVTLHCWHFPDCMGQWRLDYSNMSITRKIWIVMRKSWNGSQKQTLLTIYQNRITCIDVKYINCCKIENKISLIICDFQLFVHFIHSISRDILGVFRPFFEECIWIFHIYIHSSYWIKDTDSVLS
jgi:hypothetical protein